MGNCLSKKAKPNLNENSNVQRRLRIGIGLKKSEDGEFHFGLEGGFEKRKKKEFSVIENYEISKPSKTTEPPETTEN